MGCVREGDEEVYRTVEDNFASWSEQNYVQFNVLETKELVVKIRKRRTLETYISIHSVCEKTAEYDKYFGFHTRTTNIPLQEELSLSLFPEMTDINI